MQILRPGPTFSESWRRAGPEERADLIFILVLSLSVALVMALSAAFIGWLVYLVGYPKIGMLVAAGLFLIAARQAVRG